MNDEFGASIADLHGQDEVSGRAPLAEADIKNIPAMRRLGSKPSSRGYFIDKNQFIILNS